MRGGFFVPSFLFFLHFLFFSWAVCLPPFYLSFCASGPHVLLHFSSSFSTSLFFPFSLGISGFGWAASSASPRSCGALPLSKPSVGSGFTYVVVLVGLRCPFPLFEFAVFLSCSVHGFWSPRVGFLPFLYVLFVGVPPVVLLLFLVLRGCVFSALCLLPSFWCSCCYDFLLSVWVSSVCLVGAAVGPSGVWLLVLGGVSRPWIWALWPAVFPLRRLHAFSPPIFSCTVSLAPLLLRFRCRSVCARLWVSCFVAPCLALRLLRLLFPLLCISHPCRAAIHVHLPARGSSACLCGVPSLSRFGGSFPACLAFSFPSPRCWLVLIRFATLSCSFVPIFWVFHCPRWCFPLSGHLGRLVACRPDAPIQPLFGRMPYAGCCFVFVSFFLAPLCFPFRGALVGPSCAVLRVLFSLDVLGFRAVSLVICFCFVRMSLLFVFSVWLRLPVGPLWLHSLVPPVDVRARYSPLPFLAPVLASRGLLPPPVISPSASYFSVCSRLLVPLPGSWSRVLLCSITRCLLCCFSSFG